MKKLFAILLILALSGCASSFPPSSTLIETVPIIQMGNTNTVPVDHIVYIPENTTFPMTFSTEGNAINKATTATITTSFQQDLYIYKNWASLDGKNWEDATQLINFQLSPRFDKSGGKVGLRLELKK